jgi:hypothetical protein
MKMMRMFCLAAAVALCGVASAASFHKIDGTKVSGVLQGVDAKGAMTIQPEMGDAVTIPSDELMRIEFGVGREALAPNGVGLHLPRGDRVNGALRKCSPVNVEVASPALGKVALSLEKLLAVEFLHVAEEPKDAAKMRAAMLANKTQNDISFSMNGDQMPGILVGFKPDKIKLKASLGEMSLDTARLFGVSLAARKRPPPPASLLAVARCTDGSVVTGTLMASKGGIKLALLAGPEVEIRSAHLIELGFRQGKLVYLSDLDPAKEEARPYFTGDHTWPYQRDKSYDRKPIRLGGKVYRKGLGMFAGMKLTYQLGGEFKKFVSLVGIDDADEHNKGDVTVRVLADGKEVFKKAGLTRKSGPVKIDLSVKGVKTLELAVDFGGNMLFGDITDWADAHLIR